MHTRMVLVPDSWEDPRGIPLDALPDDDGANPGTDEQLAPAAAGDR